MHLVVSLSSLDSLPWVVGAPVIGPCPPARLDDEAEERSGEVSSVTIDIRFWRWH